MSGGGGADFVALKTNNAAAQQPLTRSKIGGATGLESRSGGRHAGTCRDEPSTPAARDAAWGLRAAVRHDSVAPMSDPPHPSASPDARDAYPEPFLREHFERYLRKRWAEQGEALAPDARLGIAIDDLVRTSAERNAKVDAPYLDLWIANFDEFNSWLVSLLSTVYAPARRDDAKLNDFERSVVVLLGKLIADTTALRHLITLGYVGSARTLLRSTAEYMQVLVALIDDPALASAFVTADTPETANAFFFGQLARGKLHKRLEAAWARFFKTHDDSAQRFAEQQRRHGALLSGTAHPSFAGATQAVMGFIDLEPDENWLGHWGARSNMSVTTVALYADCLFPLLLLNDFPFDGFDAVMRPIGYDPVDEMHRHVKIGRRVLASLILSLNTESNHPYIYPPGFAPSADEDDIGGAPADASRPAAIAEHTA